MIDCRHLQGETNMSDNDTGKFFFTAGQLIDILKTFPPDMPVLVQGSESGYDNFHQPYKAKLTHEPGSMESEGEFQITRNGGKEAFEAIVLQRVFRD